MPPAEKKDISPTASSQLVTAMITSPPSPSPLETVIIFDWDDTLLASSYLSSKGHRLDNNLERGPELEQQLKELEVSVIGVLTLALGFGPVHIVTNAETGWVQMSAQKFIPAVVPLLSRVKVVSARSTYESAFPDAPLKWKFYAFQEKLKDSFGESKCERNVISFGDSYVEREAVRAVTKGWVNTRTKSVKFAERPSMEQLRRQIELVSNCFQYIFNHSGDLDLQLTVTVNSGNSQPSSPTAAPVAPPSPSQQPVPVPMSIAGPAALAHAAPLPGTDPTPLRRVTPPTTPTHTPLTAPLLAAGSSAAAAAAAAANAAASAAASAAPLAFAHTQAQAQAQVQAQAQAQAQAQVQAQAQAHAARAAPGTPKTVPKSPAHSSLMPPPLVPNSPRTTTAQVSTLIFAGSGVSPSAAAAAAAAAAATAAAAAGVSPRTGPAKPPQILLPHSPPALKLHPQAVPQSPLYPTAMHAMMAHPHAHHPHGHAHGHPHAHAHPHPHVQPFVGAGVMHPAAAAHMKSAVFHAQHHHHVPAHAAPMPMAIRS